MEEKEVEKKEDLELGLHLIKNVFEKDIETTETKIYKGAVRSGQKLTFEGSLVIIGDVNGGAEVIAGEHIIVIGELRGLAHAGASGNTKAIIAASSINSPQIRISNIVKELDESIENENGSLTKYVYVNKNEIIIE